MEGSTRPRQIPHGPSTRLCDSPCRYRSLFPKHAEKAFFLGF
ncbi:hypothetical protein F383_29176 [Gossypium arboreum]|uniref:Uncharacterized protein n=1 Tax=Gossypium arboreum TaxID=29729 RepID=A0A0B0PJJ5_GOSAR|nr:hypothetical protein F383_29176 [Gossypium arboreum]